PPPRLPLVPYTTLFRSKIQVRDPGGTILSTLASYSNLNTDGGYEQKTFDLSAFKGRSIKLYFLATEDAAKQTSFVIDDLALTTSDRKSTRLNSSHGSIS